MGTLLHAVHGVIIAIGAIAVLAMLLPARDRPRDRDLARLKRAAASDTLVLIAQQRAALHLAESAPQSAPVRPAHPRSPWLVTAAVTSVAAAVIHGAVGPEHFREALRLGLFFVVICAAELVLAGLILRRPSRAVVTVAAVVNALTVGLWIVTRTVGLPFALAEIEPVGVLDAMASAVEVISVACCSGWILRKREATVTVRPSLRMPAPAGGLIPGRLSHRQKVG